MIQQNGSTARRRRRRVAVIVDASQGFGRGVLHGVAAWIRRHEPWSVLVAEHELERELPTWLERGRIDGVISRLDRGRLPAALRKPSIPFVRVASIEAKGTRPAVCSDEQAVGRLAADHLADQGFRQLAFCGVNTRWSSARQEGFVSRAMERGCRVDVFGRYSPAVAITPCVEHEALSEWIRSLSLPVGIMAATDLRARHVLDACHDLGIDVPARAAVIGVDDDDLVCDLATPSLTSVAQNLEQIGYRAADVLAGLMEGDRAAEEARVNVAPLGVHVRESSAAVAVDDADLRVALAFIRENACNGIDIEALADATSLTRRTLERRFQKELGRSIKEEILRTKIHAARQLLADTDDKLLKIALATGFADVASFCHAFKRVTGQRPGDFKKECRPWTADADGNARPRRACDSAATATCRPNQ